jgi:N-acyl-D-aspartate/D-glutamate deacylase
MATLSGLWPLGRATVVLVLLLAVDAAYAGLPTADVLIRGGSVYDGSDAPPRDADVVIAGDRIVYVGQDAAAHYDARWVRDARGLLVAPGFIDAHTHPDTYIRSPDARVRLNAPWLFQGVTTVVIGVDGSGTPDVAAESAGFARARVGTNIVPYVGFGAIRERILKDADRAPTAAELDAMRALVARGMCEGAVGLSTGLFYAPQSFATTAEVTALAREAARRDGLFDTHQRDESSYTIGLLGSVAEVLQIGRDAAIPVHFAHIKALGIDVQGKADEVIALIDKARAAGQDVSADQYPWSASGSSLEAALLPRWAFDGGRAALLRRLADPTQVARIRTDMQENLRRRGGPASLLLTTAGMPWTGRTLAVMARRWRLDPLAAAIRIIRSGADRGDVASFNMVEEDIRRFMRAPWVLTSSDGSDGHPRQYATFPRKYRKYVLEDHVITLGEFIRSSTGRTADRFRLEGRGYLRPGDFADVVLLDPERYAPRADYLHPRRLASGVRELWVNGRAVIREGHLTGEAPGRVLLHTPPPGTCP